MIETVLGPIRPEELGVTSMNEHLLTDSSQFLRPAREPAPDPDRLTIENLGFLRWNYLGSRDNLVLDEPEVAAAELEYAGGLGLRSVVDVTPWGMGPRHADLPAIARASGTQVAVAYGSYIARSLPPWIAELSEAELEDHFRTALVDGIPGAGYRAAMLGLMGTSATIEPVELRALRAAARAAASTGASVSIRLDAASRLGPDVLGILAAAGLDPHRVLFSNVDKVMDDRYVAELAATGATLEVAFGSESYFGDAYRDPTDAERLDFLLRLIDAGHSLVLACSVWTKGQLHRYGGMGYGHVVGRIVPALQRAGVSQDRIDDMLVTRPRQLLDRPAAASAA